MTRATRAGSEERSDIVTRRAAVALVTAVLDRRITLSTAFAAGTSGNGPAAALESLAARDRAFARLIATTVLRRLGEIDRVLSACLEKPLPNRDWFARGVLRAGVAQLLFIGTPAHAAVDASVSLLKRDRPGLSGLVNAVLRRIDRERGRWNDPAPPGLDTPDWLWRRWVRNYGADTAARIEAAHLADPPIDVSLKDCSEDSATRWARELEAEPLPTGGLRRSAGGAIDTWPGYSDGAWWVQDAAASLPAQILMSAMASGETETAGPVLDLCAAPGGKTAQLAAAGLPVTAVDLDPARIARLEHNLARLGLKADLVEADAATVAAPARAVLLDAPCTATGTIRRHPDVQHLRHDADLALLVRVQTDLLRHAASLVSPGGVLVYAVCSLEPEEGEQAIDRFLSGQTSEAVFARLPVRAVEIGGFDSALTAAGDVRTLPCHLAGRGGMDGFYIARLKRTD